jgi:hypothetical protein
MRTFNVTLSGFRPSADLTTSFQYEAMIQPKRGPRGQIKTFENERELIAVLNGLFERQKMRRNIKEVIPLIQAGRFQSFDLDLSDDQAEALGWKSDNQQ